MTTPYHVPVLNYRHHTILILLLCVCVCVCVCSRQLCVCLEQILRHDFPHKWTGIVMAVHGYLSSDNQGTWLGSLLSLYQLSKKYKYVWP